MHLGKILAIVFLLCAALCVLPDAASAARKNPTAEELFQPNGSKHPTPAFMPSQHYLVRVVLFAQDTRRGGTVFLGDSITEGWLVFPQFAQKGLRNRGIGGDTTFGVLMRLNELVLEKPDKIFILLGVNDLIRNELHGLVQRYEYIVSTLEQALPKTEIYIQSLLPVNWEDFPRVSEYVDNDKIHDVNERLKKLADRTDVEFIDLAPHFEDSNGNLKKALSIDGLHINQKGYAVWYDLIKDEL